MKKFNKFGYASAMLLATAMGFTGCSSDDEMENINPTYDGNSVKTQFAISLTQKANKGKRMSTAQTQSRGEFQGMTNIHLYHFKTSTISGTTANVGCTPLSDFDAPNYESNVLNANLNAKYYQNVAIEAGVNHFLFYGQTSNADITDDKNTKAKYADPLGTVEETTFTPVEIIPSANKNAFNAAKAGLVAQWNTIYGLFNESGLPKSIKEYQAIIENMADGGSASSNSMFALVKDIYNDIKIQYEGMPAGDSKTTATETLMNYLLQTAGMEISGDVIQWIEDENNVNYKEHGFPTSYGLPEGAMALAWDNDSKEVSIDTQYDLNNSNEIETYVRPASLFYYVNTPAGVKNQTYFGEGKKNEQNWNSLATTEYNKGAISAVTRSVILWDQVQYGVARLETTVQLGDELTDSKLPVPTIVNTSSFEVTGVLVGGQKAVDWQFKPMGDDQYVIWDKDLTSEMIATEDAASAVNHTLVYETAERTPVNIAIELINNGDDFYGAHNKVVRNGQKFYLVAQLNPTAVGLTQPDPLNPITQVFKQDYVTRANLTISSLAGAYNVIPNLEQSNLEFGMSVDLEWQTGLTFNVTIQ